MNKGSHMLVLTNHKGETMYLGKDVIENGTCVHPYSDGEELRIRVHVQLSYVEFGALKLSTNKVKDEELKDRQNLLRKDIEALLDYVVYNPDEQLYAVIYSDMDMHVARLSREKCVTHVQGLLDRTKKIIGE